MFRSSEGSNSDDTNIAIKQQEINKEMNTHNIDIDPNDPKANEAAKIIQHAYRKHQEQLEQHDSCCHKNQNQDMSS